MSASGGEIRQKLDVAAELHGVVRTMKAMAASSIVKYERAADALAEYDQAVRLGLGVALREIEWQPVAEKRVPSERRALNAVVFGSDQGLVAQFNDVIVEFAITTLGKLPGSAAVWAVGERVYARLADAGLSMRGLFRVPNDVNGIAAVVEGIHIQTESPGLYEKGEPLYVFYNRRQGAGYEPLTQRLLPLDVAWRNTLIGPPWPGNAVPEILGDPKDVLRGLVREYLFISLFRACAESLASESASRLAAMQRAEKNIGEITELLTHRLNRARQATIDEELFDVVAGFEALN